MIKNWTELFSLGGYTMIALGACSILSLSVIMDRFYTLRKTKIVPPNLLQTIGSSTSLNDLDQSLKKTKKSLLGEILIHSLQNTGLSKQENIESTEKLGKQTIHHLERGLVVLEIIAMVSPLLGLLGTVLGLQDVFQVISMEGVSEVKLFSGGISKALITTTAGLSIAIPTLIAHGLFKRKITHITLLMETALSTLINKIYRSSNAV